MHRLKLSIAILLCLVFGLLAVRSVRTAIAAEGRTAEAGTSPAAGAPDGGVALPFGSSDPAAQDAARRASTRALIASLTVFVLAIFVGFAVITKVPPTLHTPLMSGSNAISGITVVGALVAAGAKDNQWATLLGMVAVALATVNVVGGFLVTHRMLKMFRKK